MKKLIIRLILGSVLVVAAFVWMGSNQILDESTETRTLTLVWLFLGIGFITIVLSILDRLLDWPLPWKRYPGTRFIVQMIVGTGVSLVCLNISFHIIRTNYTASAPDSTQQLVMNLYGAALILPIFSLYFGYKFLKDWRRSELETERLLKENARSQMMSLKNHLDPHFLFNNLNILSSLIDKDPNLSKDYLDKFASVYRIILKSETDDLTTIEEELQLIDAYVHLLKIRFQDNIIFDLRVNPDHYAMGIPPLSLQMLIENAIKHNMATKTQPLHIKVYSENDMIMVENNIQKRKYAAEEREGSGLENIKNRYAFFSDKDMRVDITDILFKVNLPLIEIEYEN